MFTMLKYGDHFISEIETSWYIWLYLVCKCSIIISCTCFCACSLTNDQELTVKQWLGKHGLTAKKLTILDALAPTIIPHKAKYVPILDKHVLAKVFNNVSAFKCEQYVNNMNTRYGVLQSSAKGGKSFKITRLASLCKDSVNLIQNFGLPGMLFSNLYACNYSRSVICSSFFFHVGSFPKKWQRNC